MSHMESFLEAMSTNGEGEGGSCGTAEALQTQPEGLGNETHQQENCGSTRKPKVETEAESIVLCPKTRPWGTQ